MKKALVVGASGGMGYALVQELVSKGVKVVAFARGETKLKNLFQKTAGVTIYPGDALKLSDVMNASKDVDVIFHAVSFPYPEWSRTHIPCMDNLIHVGEVKQLKIVLADNIYAYGKQKNRVSETAVKMPHTKKGLIRLEMERRLKNSKVHHLIVHLPDLYGPNANNTLLYETLKNVVENKKTNYIGDPCLQREFIYTKDAAKAVVNLSLQEDTYDQNWNIPAAHPISGEEVVKIIREITGYQKSIRIVKKNMIRFMSIFSPFMKEMIEMMYLTEEPVILSGEKYEQKFTSVPQTPYKIGLEETLSWIENKA